MNTPFAETVVVGAGAAGAVIAARVSERSSREVLLVEAGPDYPDPATLPHDLVDGTQNSMRAHDWGYTHKVNSVQPLRFPLPRGRVVGGSSAVNTCVALRGVPADFDEWASFDLPEWSWARCLPAFKRLEHDLDMHDAWHGNDGPIPIRRHTRDELVPWQAAFMDACASLGLPHTADHNHPEAHGYGAHAMNKIQGVRMSAARCYLTPSVRARPNLRVRPHTTVRRLLFARDRIEGIEVETHGVVSRIEARRVVLCAGAIATPGLLLRSGIGPRDVVTRLGVTLRWDVPAVGTRLLDHPGAAFFLRPKAGVTDPSYPILQTAIRFRSKHGTHDNDLQVQPGSRVVLPFVPFSLVSMMCHVGKPRGVGSLVWRSANVHTRPEIRSALLDDAGDRALAVEALTMARAIVSASPMRDMASIVWPPPWVVRRNESLDRWIRGVCDSGYHPCGTVPMGRGGAVDGRGRLLNLHGLIIADASLMPTIPTGNIHLPTLMIGERFGEWLRDEAP